MGSTRIRAIRRRIRRIRIIAALSSLWLALSSTSVSNAQQQGASAEELFQLGKGAMQRQELTKACNYFQASLSAEFAHGTLLNLAICHEQAGKIASAWAEYRTLEDRARRASPPQLERAQFAHDHAEALRARLSRVHIIFVSDVAKAIPGIVVKIDGVVAAPELFDAGIAVDLGKRKLTASAPDYEEYAQIISVDDEKLKIDVTVPVLKKKPGAASSSSSSSTSRYEAERLAQIRSQKAMGYIVGGVGAASLITGGVFGVLALRASNQAECKAPCYTKDVQGNDNVRLTDAQDAYQRAKTFAWVSDIGLGVGVLGLGISGYLLLTVDSDTPGPSSKASWRITPTTLDHGAGVVFAGAL